MEKVEGIYAKIWEIQKIIRPLVKNETNKVFHNTYFDINTLLATLKPLLLKLNVMLIQPLTEIDGRPAINTILIDMDNGDKASSTFPFPDLQDPQKMGGAITYYRRYALVSLFVLEAEDDDGNTATGQLNASDDAFADVPKKAWKPCADCSAQFEVNPKYPNATRCYPCAVKAKAKK